MLNVDIGMGGMVAITASIGISLLLLFYLCKRPDPTYYKIGLAMLALIPVLGPVFLLWLLVFPSRLPVQMQAEFPKKVNIYSYPVSQSQTAQEAKPSRNTRASK